MFPELTRDDVFRLETRRLWLRWPRASDAAAIGRIVSRDEVADAIASIPHPYPAGGAEAYVLAARAGNAEGRTIELAITLKTTQEPIGQIGVRIEEGEMTVGYLVDPERWDQGYATEALAAVVDVVFALTFAPRIRARVTIDNEASAHVLEKQGFVPVGEETVTTPARGGPRRCRTYELERGGREGLRPRRVPAMSQQSLSQQSLNQHNLGPQSLTGRTSGAAPAPEAARAWM